MLRTMKTRAFGLIAVGIVVLASACSSNNNSGTAATGSATTQQPTTTAPPASSPASGNQVTITMVDFNFKPSAVTASTSQDIVLTNNGSALHNFSITSLGIDQDVQPGQTVTLTAPGPSVKPGSYDFFCKYHKSQGMVGTLTATSP
jgi:plastocyanin